MEDSPLGWDQFRVDRLVGRGNFSAVYRARWIDRGEDVALKRLQVGEMVDNQAITDCLKEIALLQKVDHENVIKCLGSFMEGGELVMVLELAEWGDLERLVHAFRRRHKLIPEATVWRYFFQAAAALDHMHSKRIMHRDIKPSNVFVTSDGVVKLGDFGLSRHFSPKTVAAHTLVGTPYYMSPERLRQQGYTFSSDVWSMGCLLYEMAALQSPFYGERMNLFLLTRTIEMGKYPPIPSPIYTKQLSSLVNKCLQVDPDQRPSMSYVYCVAATLNAQMSRSKAPPLPNDRGSGNK